MVQPGGLCGAEVIRYGKVSGLVEKSESSGVLMETSRSLSGVIGASPRRDDLDDLT